LIANIDTCTKNFYTLVLSADHRSQLYCSCKCCCTESAKC